MRDGDVSLQAYGATGGGRWRALGHACVAGGVLFACAASLACGLTIGLKAPAILLAGCIVLWPATVSGPAGTLQRIAGAYLLSVAVNQIAPHAVGCDILDHRVAVSMSLIALTIVALGATAERLGRDKRESAERPAADGMRSGWLGAGGLIGGHALAVGAMLVAVYGYGYEQSLTVLGKVALFGCLYFLTGGTLQSPAWRRVICVGLAAYYAAVTCGVGVGR